MQDVIKKMEKVEETFDKIIDDANRRLIEIGRADIVLRHLLDYDSARVYAGSENEPICEVAVAGSEKSVIKRIETRVSRFIKSLEPKQKDSEPATAEPVAESDAEQIAETPAAETQALEEQSTVEKAHAEQAVAEPVAEEPVAEEPVAEAPVAEAPAAEEPAATEPVDEEPAAEEPVAEAPAAEEPVAAEPVAEEPHRPPKSAYALKKERRLMKERRLKERQAQSDADRRLHKQDAKDEHRASWIDGLMESVERVISHANERLMEEIWSSFKYEDVIFSASCDDVAIYVHSGALPVCIVARNFSSERILRTVREGVWSELDSIKATAHRRAALMREEMKLGSEDYGMSVVDDPSSEIVSAAREAAKDANRGLAIFEDVCSGIYGESGDMFKIRGFAGGFVMSMAGYACFVSRFPKVWNAKTISTQIDFIKRHIGSIGESFRAHLVRAKKSLEREAEFREIGKLQAEVNRRLKAVS